VRSNRTKRFADVPLDLNVRVRNESSEVADSFLFDDLGGSRLRVF
jgi:hypothetical protein